MGDSVVIEAALNGGRDRREHPAVPLSPSEIAEEAARCAAAGASLVHVHARDDAGGWNDDADRYAETIRLIRRAAPELPVGITSIRPDGVGIGTTILLLNALATDPETLPEAMSINLGHIAAWEPDPAGGRRTVHYPNGYKDVVGLLRACAAFGIRPELGVMDFGFVSNAAALRDDGALPPEPWFLLELDSPGFGRPPQVAPATVAAYDALAAALREQFPAARWAAHGQGVGTFAVVRRVLEDGSHVRVGFEDAVVLPDGRVPASNAELVEWAVTAARAVGREPAGYEETRRIVGLG